MILKITVLNYYKLKKEPHAAGVLFGFDEGLIWLCRAFLELLNFLDFLKITLKKL